jgi:hypothetical protein
MMADLFEHAERAKAARDRGLERVTNNNPDWLDQALKLIPRLSRQIGEFTGEALRLELEAVLGPIPNPNLMGGIIRTALKRRLIEPTGKRVSMRTQRSHARKTDLYRGL